MTITQERRKHPRVEVDWPAIVQTSHQFIGGDIGNISTGGVFIHCLTSPAQDGPFSIFIKTPREEKPLLATGRLAWSNILSCDDDIDSCGFGLRFTKLSRESRRVLSEATSEHSKSTDRQPDGVT